MISNSIGSLMALATPQSQLKLAYRTANPEDRYLLVALQQGRWMSIDRYDRNKASILGKQPLAVNSKAPLIVEMLGGNGLGIVENYSASRLDIRPATDGEYPLERSGKIVVKGGLVVGVERTPHAVAAPTTIA